MHVFFLFLDPPKVQASHEFLFLFSFLPLFSFLFFNDIAIDVVNEIVVGIVIDVEVDVEIAIINNNNKDKL